MEIWILFVIISTCLAITKRRNVFVWFFSGLLFGPLSVIAALLVPEKNHWNCSN